jgi:nitrogen regulatory protein PII
MDAARSQKAGGGTVIHAKGTGIERAEKFLGVSLVKEKEMVFIVVRTELRNNIIKAIMEEAGLRSKAQAIAFSLPVSAVAGMRLVEADENEEKN